MCGWLSNWKRSWVAALFSGEYHWEHGCKSIIEARSTIVDGKEVMPDRSKYFKAARFLGPDDVKNGQFLQIDSFDEINTRVGLRAVLRLKGFEQPFTLNATNYDFLTDKFGEDEKKWAGKRIKVAIIKVNNPQTGKMQNGIRLE
jgi:hypothetical protein